MSSVFNYVSGLIFNIWGTPVESESADKVADSIENKVEVAALSENESELADSIENKEISEEEAASSTTCFKSELADSIENKVEVAALSEDESDFDFKAANKKVYQEKSSHRKASPSTQENSKRSTFAPKNPKADKKADLQEWIQHAKDEFLARRF